MRVAGNRFHEAAVRYGRFRGNKAEYLRSIGVQIGTECDILIPIRNFGTEPWLIKIGDRVTIAQGVVLLTHDGANRVFRLSLPDASPWGNRFAPITIGDDCFIGVNSIIMPGVTIGHRCIVGVNSVVKSDVPDETVVAGSPARVIATLAEFRARYLERALPIAARNREELRAELTTRCWGRPH